MATLQAAIRWVCAGAMVVTLGAAGQGAEPPAKKEEPVDARKALQRRVTFEFGQTPLTDVTKFISQYTRLNIVFDGKGLDAVNVQRDVPISFQAQEMLLSEALDRMLEGQGLAYAVDDNVVVISSAEEAKKIREAATPKVIPKPLDKVVTIAFTDEPLESALQTLSKQLPLKLRIAPEAAEKAKQPVTLALTNVHVETALKYLLRERELTATAQDGDLVVKPIEQP